MSPGEDIIEDYVWDDDEKYLTFRTVVDTTAGATAKPVQYKLVPSRTVTVEENGEATSVQCYEVQRLVFDGMIWEADGKSPDTVVEFEIELLDDRGDPLGADLSKTRQILVRVAAISPMGQDEVIRKTRWQTTFHPINLALLDR